MAQVNKFHSLNKQSSIKTPPARYGVILPKQIEKERAIYGGEKFPYFLLKHGGNPRDYRRFWEVNRVGAVSDVKPGQAFEIPLADRYQFR